MITCNYLDSTFKVTEWTKKYRKNGMEFPDFVALSKVAEDKDIQSTDEEVQQNKNIKQCLTFYLWRCKFLDLFRS